MTTMCTPPPHHTPCPQAHRCDPPCAAVGLPEAAEQQPQQAAQPRQGEGKGGNKHGMTLFVCDCVCWGGGGGEGFMTLYGGEGP